MYARLSLSALFAAGCACETPPPGRPDAYVMPCDAPTECSEWEVFDVTQIRPGELTLVESYGAAPQAVLPSVVDQTLYLSAVLTMGSTIRHGIVAYASGGAESLEWIATGGARGLSLSVSRRLRIGLVDGTTWWTLDVRRRSDEFSVLAVPLMERWPDASALGACNAQFRQLQIIGDDERPFLIRASDCEGAQDEGTDVHYRIHVWDSAGREETPVEGVPVSEHVYMVPWLEQASTLWATPAGELWYGAERAALDGSGPVALRIVHRARDMSLVMVSDPITDPTIDLPEPGGAWRAARGFWGRPTADGAYVAHVIAPTATGEVARSQFVRVEADGTIAWRNTTYARAARDLDHADTMLAEHDGGIVALVSDASLPADLSFFAIRSDGSLVHGETGIAVAERVGFDAEHRDDWIAVDSDGSGGLFVVRAGRRSHLATHLLADGTTAFERVEIGHGAMRPDADIYLVIADGAGGFWHTQVGPSTAGIQHVDSAGRPAYGMERRICDADECAIGWTDFRAALLDRPALEPGDGGIWDGSISDAGLPDAWSADTLDAESLGPDL